MSSRFLFIGLLLITACAPKTILLTRSQLLMGHVPVNVTIETTPDRKAEALELSEEAYARAKTLENKISEYQPNSEVSCLNRQAGRGFCILSPETYALLEEATDLSHKTGHAFDIRFASPTEGGRKGRIIFESAGRVRLSHPETRIGVGAIGKGFIVDQMIEFLRSKGVAKALVDAGGDLKALGGPWAVAIQRPGGNIGETQALPPITNLALSTSGNYEQEGHILDPRSGKQVTRPESVTVLAKSHTLADALATAFYVLGEKESLLYQKKFPGIEMIWANPVGPFRSYPSPSELLKSGVSK